MAADPPDIDSAVYRQVLGYFPTGVTIVTAETDHHPVGLAVGSFASLSLDPPLVLFCPSNTSTSWPHIESAGKFCVNVLAADQEGVCRHFAGKSDDKFAGIGYRHSPLGSPIIDGVLAWIDCEIESVVAGGDHVIVVGRVHDLDVAGSGGPLVFFRGGYGRFEV